MEDVHRDGAGFDWVYHGSDFQNYFQVYGRKGLPCLTCGTPITRLLVSQRGTHVCETCQHLSS
jgi:formamidopyrimidine-DNA glycosylase